VKVHLHNVYRKLHVSNRTGLILSTARGHQT
jgi:DNA-binding NarL/FixJ family response regulator